MQYVIMKVVKIPTIFLILLIAFPFVNAIIALDPLGKDKYNLGDKFFLSGEVARNSATRGYITFDLLCENSTTKVAAFLVDVNENRVQKISQAVLVPRNVFGMCELQATFTDENTGEVLEVAKLSAFEITNELNGIFDINKNKFQLGDTLIINGNVNKYDNSPVSGLVTFYFKKGESTIFLDNVGFSNGILEYKKDMGFIPPGDYVLDLEVADNYGNSKYYNNLYSIEINGNIQIATNFDKIMYQPGDKVVLNGFVNGLNNAVLSNVELDFVLEDGEKASRTLGNLENSFTITFSTSNTIKSGKHWVMVYARSEGGNYGVKTVNFTIDQVPTKLDLQIKSSSFIPGDDIFFTLGLLDQAGDKVESGMNVGLLDKANKIVASGLFGTNSDGSLKVPEGASPGIWKLKAEKYGLSKELVVNINEYIKLDANLEGNALKVKNVGNVKYKGPLTIISDGIEKTKNVGLGLGETKEFDLGSLLPSGVHDINIPLADKEFKGVNIEKPKSNFAGFGGITTSITGNVAKNVESPGRRGALTALLLIIVGCMVYLFVHRRKKNGGLYNDLRQSSSGQQRSFVNVGEKVVVSRKPVEYGKATEKDIADFRMRIQKQFQEQEKQKSKSEFLRFQDRSMGDDRPKGGLFNMFN